MLLGVPKSILEINYQKKIDALFARWYFLCLKKQMGQKYVRLYTPKKNGARGFCLIDRYKKMYLVSHCHVKNCSEIVHVIGKIFLMQNADNL